MKIIITIKDTDNIIGLKEDIAMRLEGVADIVRIDTADVAPKSEVAREIFAEIERVVGYALCVDLTDWSDYTELKNKYTEGEEC
jgi:hypothetical protein